MKRLNLICLLLPFIPIKGFCQDVKTGIVTYTDSTSAPANYHLRQTGKASDDYGTTTMLSRQGKFEVDCCDNFFLTEGVKRCLRMALDAWEEKINIDVPIKFMFTASENLNPDVEIKTTVTHYGYRNVSYPANLFSQIKEGGVSKLVDTINVNALVDWNTSWDNDNTQWGTGNLQTALQRHIAHILGFGTSVVKRAGGLGFAIQRTPSVFDNLISNGQTILGNLARYGTSAQINEYFKNDLFVSAANASYPLFSSSEGYIPYRSGCHFAQSENSIMNYPYGDRSILMTIDGKTLDVLAAIGWNVKPHDITISGTDVDAIGYGSIYKNHTFHAEDANGNIISDGRWTYQIYNKDSRSYVDKFTGQGEYFSVNATDEGSTFTDEFSCLQGRIVLTANTGKGDTQYTLPLSLNQRPHFINYEILNVQEVPNSDYYSFDLKISSIGATKGEIMVSSDFGTLNSYKINNPDEQTIHIEKALKFGHTYLYLDFYNSHGMTARKITLNEYPNLQSENKNGTTGISPTTEWDVFDVYTLQGIKIASRKSLSNLEKGTYIIKSTIQPWKSKKIFIK